MLRKALLYIRNLVVASILIFILVKLSTFGWLPTGTSTPITPTEHISAQKLRDIVSHLSETLGNRNLQNPDALNASRDFIQNHFQTLGYTVTLQSFETDDQTFHNIIAEKPSSKSNKPKLIIGAHYDTCFNPGADDNASGVASMILLAELLESYNSPFDITFVAFVNEEPPFFESSHMGSRVYARMLKETDATVAGAIVLEMVGYYTDEPFSQRYLPLIGPFYPNRGNFIAFVGNFPSKPFTKKITKAFQNQKSFPSKTITAPEFIPGIYFSDHASFWKEEYPAIMVTDTAYLRNPNYHKQSDLPDTLNFDMMAQMTHTLSRAIRDLTLSR